VAVELLEWVLWFSARGGSGNLWRTRDLLN